MQTAPNTHAIGLVYLMPPHCLYRDWVLPEEEVEVIDVFALIIKDFSAIIKVVKETLPLVISPIGVTSVISTIYY